MIVTLVLPNIIIIIKQIWIKPIGNVINLITWIYLGLFLLKEPLVLFIIMRIIIILTFLQVVLTWVNMIKFERNILFVLSNIVISLFKLDNLFTKLIKLLFHINLIFLKLFF